MSVASILILALSALALAGAWPYAVRVKHPDHKPLAAFLVFLAALAAAIAGVLALGSGLVLILAASGVLSDGWVTGLIVVLWAVAVIAGIAVGTHVVRRPPRRRMPR